MPLHFLHRESLSLAALSNSHSTDHWCGKKSEAVIGEDAISQCSDTNPRQNCSNIEMRNRLVARELGEGSGAGKGAIHRGGEKQPAAETAGADQLSRKKEARTRRGASSRSGVKRNTCLQGVHASSTQVGGY